MARFGRRSGQQMSKGCGILFGLGWTAFSMIFVVVGVWVFWDSAKSGTWTEVPCRVDRFEITNDPDADPPFQADVLFVYRHEGTWREGSALRPGEKGGSDDFHDLMELREEVMAKASVGEMTCRVNPANPDEAVLLPAGGETWFGLVFAAFGGSFVLVGIGLTVAAVKGGKAAKARTAVTSDESANGMGGLLGCGFFGVFAAAGLGILFGLVVPKGMEYLAMKRWVETPGEVIWSRVRSHSGDDGTTYSVDIFYRYRFGGEEFRSNRRGLMEGSSSGHSGKAEVVKQHPAGATVICYVDPDEPWNAVLDRKLGWWGLFALFPLPFVAVGLGGLWATFFKNRNKTGGAVTGRAGAMAPASGNVKLEGDGGTVRKRVLHVVGAIAIAAFWNGIVSVFLWQMAKDWSRGQTPWFLTIFLIPFVLIGLGLICHIFYRIFAIFSPIYRVEITDRHLSPGGQSSVSWKRTGGSGQPRKFSIWLVGREEATYRRGTDTVTATEVFHEEALIETGTRMMMPAGRVTAKLPDDAVPSFRGKHNKVRWFVVLVADVPGRPDVREEFEIDVTPRGEGMP